MLNFIHCNLHSLKHKMKMTWIKSFIQYEKQILTILKKIIFSIEVAYNSTELNTLIINKYEGKICDRE